MNTPETTPGQSLLLLGANRQALKDSLHVFDSLEFAEAAGHDVTVDRMWAHEATGLRRIDDPNTGTHLDVELLTEATALTAADIEVSRFETLPESLLSRREHIMKQRILEAAPSASAETIRRGYADTLLLMGGVAIIAGANQSLQVAAGYYEDLRQLGE